MKKKKDEITIRSSAAEYLTYVASVGDQQDSIEMRYEDENIWLTQKMMATLYDVGTNTINYHIKKIFGDSELQEDSVIRKFRITAADGKSYSTNHYSLEMIIAVGFKVNSERAVQFRKWVNQIAKDYTIKGWVMDDERLKRGTYLTEKYFDEQLERIREIRASERKFYQKVTDLYATAFDYDKTSNTTKLFFKTVQNKMPASSGNDFHLYRQLLSPDYMGAFLHFSILLSIVTPLAPSLQAIAVLTLFDYPLPCHRLSPYHISSVTGSDSTSNSSAETSSP